MTRKLSKLQARALECSTRSLALRRCPAPLQVGILSRVIVADIGGDPVFIVIPELVERTGLDVMTEGCLSLPGTQIDVARALGVEVKGWDTLGKAVRFRSHGLLARVLQHEVDHLNGILILDLSSPSVKRGSKPEGDDGNQPCPA